MPSKTGYVDISIGSLHVEGPPFREAPRFRHSAAKINDGRERSTGEHDGPRSDKSIYNRNARMQRPLARDSTVRIRQGSAIRIAADTDSKPARAADIVGDAALRRRTRARVVSVKV
ncbi:hypothetical protein EVAR_17662_1 [Eumeta japonica]|uniref:Uncharacterized protein n=1 Tax=Eumeta variegata TaxID=151549 RepID=A0A4C1URP3_EUMVA|nr:hypothetical protein EVAR_17662_1 [Eumeta japonica]